MADLDVSYDKIQAAADKVAVIRAGLQDALDHAAMCAEAVVDTEFKTETASGAYGARFSTFTTDTTALIKSLDEIRDFLRGTIDEFSSTDSGMAQGMTK